MGKIVSSFSDVLRAEEEIDIDSTGGTNITEIKCSTDRTKLSNTSTGTGDTKQSKMSDTVSNYVPSVCETCSGTSQIMSGQKNYIRRIRPLVSKCCITETNKVILSEEITSENKEATFSSRAVEEENNYLYDWKASDTYEENCVQILDAIPLNSDDFEESVIEYYDSLINM